MGAELFHTDGRTDRQTDGRTHGETEKVKIIVAFRTAPSAPYTRPTQQLSRPPPIQKLGTENHMLQLNISYSWWWAYAPETCRAKNTSIKLRICMKLAFHIISLGKCTAKQPSYERLLLFYGTSYYLSRPTCTSNLLCRTSNVLTVFF